MYVLDESSLKLVNLIPKAYQGSIISLIVTGSRIRGGDDLDVVIIYDEQAASNRGRESNRFEKELMEYVDEVSREIGFVGVKREDRPAASNLVDLSTLSLSYF